MNDTQELTEVFRRLISLFGLNAGRTLVISPNYGQPHKEPRKIEDRIDVFGGSADLATTEAPDNAVRYDLIILDRIWDAADRWAPFAAHWASRDDMLRDVGDRLIPGGTLIIIARNGLNFRNSGDVRKVLWAPVMSRTPGAELYSSNRRRLRKAGFSRFERFYAVPGFSAGHSEPIHRLVSSKGPAMRDFMRWYHRVAVPDSGIRCYLLRFLIWLGIPALRMSWHLILARR